MTKHKLEMKEVDHDLDHGKEHLTYELVAFGKRIGEIEIQTMTDGDNKYNQYLVTWRNLHGVPRGKKGDMSAEEFDTDPAIVQEGHKWTGIIQSIV